MDRACPGSVHLCHLSATFLENTVFEHTLVTCKILYTWHCSDASIIIMLQGQKVLSSTEK